MHVILYDFGPAIKVINIKLTRIPAKKYLLDLYPLFSPRIN